MKSKLRSWKGKRAQRVGEHSFNPAWIHPGERMSGWWHFIHTVTSHRQTHRERDRKERRNESAITTSQSTNQSLQSLQYLTPDSDSGIILPMKMIFQKRAASTHQDIKSDEEKSRAAGRPESGEDQTALCCCPKATLLEQHNNEKCKKFMRADYPMMLMTV